MKIKNGDTVKVISGKDKGKSGKVTIVYPKRNMVLVEGVNVRKRHERARRSDQKGQIIDKTLPIHASNVMVIDPKTKTPTRVGYSTHNGKKTRIARKSGAQLA